MFRVHSIASASLFIVKRPRGGSRLTESMEAIRSAGIHRLVSLLMPDEEDFHDLKAEADVWRSFGLEYLSVPVQDLGVPDDEMVFVDAVAKVVRGLIAGESAGVHCRQSIGRSGVFASAVLVALGMSPRDAFATTATARGFDLPLTEQQGQWLEDAAPRIAPIGRA